VPAGTVKFKGTIVLTLDPIDVVVVGILTVVLSKIVPALFLKAIVRVPVPFAAPIG
jgi:hypothetical protein